MAKQPPKVTWDIQTAKRYDDWYSTPAGIFALQQECALLQTLISPWPRRGQKLLEIGCGTGLFLKLFWKAGFDVTGIDASPAMLELARKRVKHRVDLHVGQADHLPFQDNEYDFVALLTVLEFLPDPSAAIREAARIARKGIIISFLNKLSCYYLSHGLRLPLQHRSMLRSVRWFTPFSLRSMLATELGPKPMAARSVLPGPTWTWRKSIPWRWINNKLYPAALGSYSAIRIDMVGEKPLSPLLSFNTEHGMSTRSAHVTLPPTAASTEAPSQRDAPPCLHSQGLGGVNGFRALRDQGETL